MVGLDTLVTMAVLYRQVVQYRYGEYITYAQALDFAYRITGTPYPEGISAN
jgi:hypothetical protein